MLNENKTGGEMRIFLFTPFSGSLIFTLVISSRKIATVASRRATKKRFLIITIINKSLSSCSPPWSLPSSLSSSPGRRCSIFFVIFFFIISSWCCEFSEILFVKNIYFRISVFNFFIALRIESTFPFNLLLCILDDHLVNKLI